MTTDDNQTSRRAALVAAERKAMQLFEAIERASLVAAGQTERMVEDAIHSLAAEQFDVKKHWHKRIVRAGTNTLTIASDNPPVRTIEDDDIVYIDLGPVFEEWEADVGRSYVVGGDSEKHALVAALPRLFESVKAHYHGNTDITGAELYEFAQVSASEAGWIFGGVIAGHIVSEFPHAWIPGNKDLSRISPKNSTKMRDPDTLGRERHWILEIHLLNQAQTFGGFYERLL